MLFPVVLYEMETSNSSSGHLLYLKHYTTCVYVTNIANDNHRIIISIVNYVFLCGFISVFGTITNMINLVIFYKQGLRSTINISFFSLTVSDLCSLLLQQVFNIYINPFFENTELPIMYSDVQYLTSGVPREAFARITSLITMYITAERCLCVTFPLHVRRMITPQRTTLVIFVIYLVPFVTILLFYCTSYIGWKFHPDRNKTLLSIIFTNGSDKAISTANVLHSVLGVVIFLVTVVFTSILTYNLGQKSAWRNRANVQQERSESLSNRDRATMRTVVLISSILIICYTPAVILCVVSICEPEFSVGGRFYNMYYIMWSFALLLENINSSVNIFLYFKMSTKYRHIFRQLFSIRTRECSDNDNNKKK